MGKVRNGIQIGTRFFRRHWYNIFRHRGKGLPSVLWIPGWMIFRSSKNKQQTSDFKLFKSLIILFLLAWTVPVWSLFASWSVSPNLSLFVVFPLMCVVEVLVIVGLVRGRRDYNNLKWVTKSGSNLTPEVAAESFDYLSSPRSEVQYNALQAILKICENTPGKVVKHLHIDVSEAAELLVMCLKSPDENVRRLAATVIKWFSRDYGRAFQPHAKYLAGLIEQSDSVLQTETAIILGNIGATINGSPDPYAKALVPAVEDEDPDVREAAALALGNLPCETSTKLLRHLTEDSAPDVQQQSRNSLGALTS